MTHRVPLNARVDEAVIAKFRDYVMETKGRIKGEMGREVERALREYMDCDRYTRIEANQDEMRTQLEELARSHGGGTHAHTNTKGSPTVERTHDIAERLQREAKGVHPNVPEEAVDRAITDIGGGDPRTIEKYKTNLKNRHLVFEHPMEGHDYWWVDGRAFAEFVLGTTSKYEDAAIEMYGEEWWESRMDDLGIDDDDEDAGLDDSTGEATENAE